MPPDRPLLGVIGTVQDGPPKYDPAKDFSVRWINGSQGSVLISGHRFAAFSEFEKPALKVEGARKSDSIIIDDQYGYRLIAIKEWEGYSKMKITDQESLDR